MTPRSWLPLMLFGLVWLPLVALALAKALHFPHP